MAVPKRRTSKTRKRKRRTHFKLTAPNLVSCPQCSSKKLSHHVCPECGYYKGTEVEGVANN
ncbi:large subunit ribosomal protein L32 [Seinonella peptonophila]|uniref:Large ribosomal subunit protein bL32 n=1 Tax=Seinonella peptonophila TaxID=112248 RepID=A0A1M4UU68_9BACL|nr:50S ribosomal protein L32 [Seinonella peptonophila]SHE60140.1 large subunit ribosomal protein L32 [Seinonella peptonophila]